MAGLKEFCVLGDSVILGIVYDEEKGRYSILRDGPIAEIVRLPGVHVTNMSRMGQTSVQAEEKFRSAVESGYRADVVVIELGGNDCNFDWRRVSEDPSSDHGPKVPLGEFRSSLKSIIGIARGAGIIPIISTLPPLAPGKFFDWITREGLSRANIMSFLGEVSRIYRWQELYSLEAAMVALESGVRLMPLRDVFLAEKEYQRNICRDGVHPNAQGQRLIKAAIGQYFASIQAK